MKIPLFLQLLRLLCNLTECLNISKGRKHELKERIIKQTIKIVAEMVK